MKKELSHIDEKGNPRMVDVSHKKTSERLASASGKVVMSDDIINKLREDGYSTKKGSIPQTAIIAATMGVKNTYNTIPLCHQIPITSCRVAVEPTDYGFKIKCTVKTIGQTGVEMEALHGVSVAALTVYDMCKALGHEMYITDIQLDQKSGGKNDFKR
ncbi:MAG: cyclic pyranopterin phosphate synthase [Halioglobus sp.]|jgi:cyclic pyranopterin phosphate synthase